MKHGLFENMPLLRFRFCSEIAKSRFVTRRIFVQPGNIPLENLLAEMPGCPNDRGEFRWGPGVHDPQTAYLVLLFLFSPKIAREFAAVFHQEFLSRAGAEFTLSSADICRWLTQQSPAI